MHNNELNKRRAELELMLASERTMCDSAKNKLILKLLNLLEAELEEFDVKNGTRISRSNNGPSYKKQNEVSRKS